MALLRLGALPDAPLAAAAAFHAEVLARVQAMLAQACDDPLTLVFAPADHTHRGWRLAAVQEIARLAAPRRVNALASDNERAILIAERYLDSAEGVTGQLFVLDGTRAGEVLC